MSKRTWILYASECAALLGLNPWRCRHDALLSLLSRQSLVSYSRKEEKDKKVLQTYSLRPTVAVEQAKETLAAAVTENKLTEDQASSALKQFHAEKRMAEGITSEREQVTDLKLKENNRTRYELMLSPSIQLIGRVDGFQQQQLYELKRRMHNLPSWIPEYDLVQVMCYMALTRSPTVIIQEMFKTQKRETELSFNVMRWKELVGQLLALVDQLEILIETHPLFEEFCEAGSQYNWPRCQHLWSLIPHERKLLPTSSCQTIPPTL